ncbi:Bardet-Biedl syndrome 12 [Chamberlinius hualienensis]
MTTNINNNNLNSKHQLRRTMSAVTFNGLYITAFLGANKVAKFIENHGGSDVIGCMASYISEMEHQHPIYSVINSHLQSHHEKHKCGSATLYSMFCFWYKAFNSIIKGQLHPNNALTEKLENMLTKTIESLTEITQYCSNIFRDHGNENVEEIVKKVVENACHDCDWACNLVSQVWVNQIRKHSRKSVKFDSSSVNVIPVQSAVSNSCVVSGLILKIKYQSAIIIQSKGSRKALIVNGSLTKNFSHKGVNFSSNIEKCQTTKEIDQWISSITSIVKQLHIDLILTSGKVDDNLSNALNELDVAIIDQIPANSFQIISDQLSSITYFTQCCQSDVTDVYAEIDQSLPFIPLSAEFRVRVRLPVQIQTVVLCHPLTSYNAHLEHRLSHFLHRLSHITEPHGILPGAGQTEKFAANYLNSLELTEFLDILSKNILQSGFEMFMTSVGTDNIDITDDYQSKVAAWISALKLLFIVIRVDYIVTGNECNHVSCL